MTDRKICSNCGTIAEPDDLFCGNCGQRLATAVTSPTQPSPSLPPKTPDRPVAEDVELVVDKAATPAPTKSLPKASSSSRVVIIVMGVLLLCCSCLLAFIVMGEANILIGDFYDELMYFVGDVFYELRDLFR